MKASSRLICIWILITSFFGSAAALGGVRLNVSVRELELQKNELIVGFSLVVFQGSVISLTKIPYGWHTCVENGGNPSINGTAIQGANALADLRFFKRFAIIEKDDSSFEPFDIRMEVYLTKDFKSVRKVSVPMSNLELVPLGHP